MSNICFILEKLNRWKGNTNHNLAILVITVFHNFYRVAYVKDRQPGLFPGKSAATVFNNKIELFEKVEGQGPGVFRLLDFRFLGYERPLETLK